ncbi:MAG: peptide deformylase [Candidatus Edwardsbacteria bacterium]|jgi:peptide deformylase|nr:peptide deformylase [Candidatus Edwardsbacteria bacterium]
MPVSPPAATQIRIYGDPVLRRKADAVEQLDGPLDATIGTLLAVLAQARGLGLAAPQIGSSRQLCAVNLPALDERRKKPLVLINPVVEALDGTAVHEEGCLSFPQIYAEVTRPRRIGIRGLDRDGTEIEIEAEDMMARVFLHEVDHLNGVLFIDHLSAIKRQLLRKQLRELSRHSRPGA